MICLKLNDIGIFIIIINQCICFCFAQLNDWVAVTSFLCTKIYCLHSSFVFKKIFIHFTVLQQLSSYYL